MSDLGLPYGAILGPFSLIDLLSVLIVAFTGWVLSGAVRRGAVSIRRANVKQTVSCDACGWVGEVSVFAPRCPSCGASIAR